VSERVRAHTRHRTSANHQHHFLSRIAASASPVEGAKDLLLSLEGAIPGAGSSPLLNYVCFDVCFDACFDVFIFSSFLFVLRVRFL